MKDPQFIQQMLTKTREAGEKVKAEFSSLNLEQLNWKPTPESWSIGQCLDHLVVSDSLYFPAMKKIAEGSYHMRAWEKWSPFTGLFGRMMVSQVKEVPIRKLKAPKILTPSTSNIDLGILERFHQHLDILSECIAATAPVNIDKTHITSPVSKFITYSLRNAITLLVQHEHRHINQAIRVKGNPNFPG